MHREQAPQIDKDTEESLCQIVRMVLTQVVLYGRFVEPKAKLSPALNQYASSFVTLYLDNQLKGCIGSLTPQYPLWRDVAENAYRSATSDYRFNPVGPADLSDVHFSITILSAKVPLKVSNEQQLLSALRPGLDGLILTESGHQAVFLPAVWDSLEKPRDFVRSLKEKAGLTPDYWSNSLRFQSFVVTEIKAVMS